jgi:hypothetical protein
MADHHCPNEAAARVKTGQASTNGTDGRESLLVLRAEDENTTRVLDDVAKIVLA